MASAIRSKLSTRTTKAVHFIVQAEDEIVNPWSELHHERARKIVCLSVCLPVCPFCSSVVVVGVTKIWCGVRFRVKTHGKNVES